MGLLKKTIMVLGFLVLLISCDEIVGIEDISEDEITILAPTDTAVISILNPNLFWNPVDGADQYKLQIATPSFEAAGGGCIPRRAACATCWAANFCAAACASIC